MPENNRNTDRYNAFIAMYDKGHAHSLDFLKADFGEWPPKELDIVNPPDFNVEIKSIFGTRKGLQLLLPSMEAVVITSLFIGKYPVAGAVTLLMSSAARVMGLGGYTNTNSPTIYMNGLYRFLGGSHVGRRYYNLIKSHEFKHIVQGHNEKESLSTSLKGNRLHIEEMLGDAPYAVKTYYADESEIQARMHTMMMSIRRQFGRVPLNNFEFLAALHSQGVALPDDVIESLKSSENGRIALYHFQENEENLATHIDRDAVRSLNKVIQAIRPEKRKIFCEKTLSFIYGDILELWGDQQGQKRMGHDHNVQLREIFYRSAVNIASAQTALIMRDEPDVALSEFNPAKAYEDMPYEDIKSYIYQEFDKAIKTIGHMDAQDATQLGCMIINGDGYREYGGASHSSLHFDDLGVEALKTIEARKDLSDYDRGVLKQAYEAAGEEPITFNDSVPTPQGAERVMPFVYQPLVNRSGSDKEFRFA